MPGLDDILPLNDDVLPGEAPVATGSLVAVAAPEVGQAIEPRASPWPRLVFALSAALWIAMTVSWVLS